MLENRCWLSDKQLKRASLLSVSLLAVSSPTVLSVSRKWQQSQGEMFPNKLQVKDAAAGCVDLTCAALLGQKWKGSSLNAVVKGPRS